MQIARTVKELNNAVKAFKSEGKSIGLVPTMGALHAGHISLVNRCKKENDITVVSLFVNPTQFNNKEDLKTYPRTEDDDNKLLSQAGCNIVFIPTVEEVYPTPDTRTFDLGDVSEVMEGAKRPGHFNGVAQIVSKLFYMVEPHRAYFGEKDFQQIAVIRSMINLEKIEVEIVSCPIIREVDGLAMSSRNVRLTPEMRKIAPNIARILSESCNFAENHSVLETQAYVINSINSFSGMEVEYYEIVDGITLQSITDWKQSQYIVGCITVYCGDVRLIDNITYYRQ